MTKFDTRNTKAKDIRSKFSSNIVKNPPVPIYKYGRVNIDNISDYDYEVVKEITDATFKRAIKWQSNDLINVIFCFFANKDLDYIYTGRYKNLHVTITSSITGKTHIKVTRGFTNKVVVDTYIPEKPITIHGLRVGTSRSMTLHNLFRAVRFQVDGYQAVS